jgi:hypothetical protein
MEEEYSVEQIVEKIRVIKATATELLRISDGFQAIDRNVDRILASVKMLEINISDIEGIV